MKPTRIASLVFAAMLLTTGCGSTEALSQAALATTEQQTQTATTAAQSSTEQQTTPAISASETASLSNEELCELALSYYGSVSGEDPSDLKTAAQTNEDGTVTIQIYSDLSDHVSTADWYTVDRVTTKGTNTMGEAICLK